MLEQRGGESGPTGAARAGLGSPVQAAVQHRLRVEHDQVAHPVALLGTRGAG